MKVWMVNFPIVSFQRGRMFIKPTVDRLSKISGDVVSFNFNLVTTTKPPFLQLIVPPACTALLIPKSLSLCTPSLHLFILLPMFYFIALSFFCVAPICNFILRLLWGILYSPFHLFSFPLLLYFLACLSLSFLFIASSYSILLGPVSHFIIHFILTSILHPSVLISSFFCNFLFPPFRYSVFPPYSVAFFSSFLLGFSLFCLESHLLSLSFPSLITARRPRISFPHLSCVQIFSSELCFSRVSVFALPPRVAVFALPPCFRSVKLIQRWIKNLVWTPAFS
jgi:hypothetical protein